MSICPTCGSRCRVVSAGDFGSAPGPLATNSCEPLPEGDRIKELEAELAKVRGDLIEQVRRKRVTHEHLRRLRREIESALERSHNPEVEKILMAALAAEKP